MVITFRLLLLDKSNGNVVISNENIDPGWVPQVPGIKITVLPPSAIQEKANKVRKRGDDQL